MIRHLVRLTWNRKRSTGLVFLELVGCFLVLCIVATAAVFTLDNWRRPLGFEWRPVLTAELGIEMYRLPVEKRGEAIADIVRLLREIQALPEVEAAGLMENMPYDGSESSWTFTLDGREVNVLWSSITPDLPRALGLRLVRGRWFERGDETLQWTPVLVSENLARARFGSGDPLGKQLRSNERDPDPDDPDLRVVGVIADYRRNGETRQAPLVAFGLARFDPANPGKSDMPPRSLIVRVRPGTGAQFEEKMARHIQSLLPAVPVDIGSLESARQRWLRNHLVPMVVAAVIAGFLLLMVGFGLVGVLWHSVTRRTSELGLRRAVGATARDVRGQIIGELATVTAFAVAAGAIVFVQLPATGAFQFVPARAYAYGLALATLVIYAFVVICALYPGWLATRVQPAVALQHE